MSDPPARARGASESRPDQLDNAVARSASSDGAAAVTGAESVTLTQNLPRCSQAADPGDPPAIPRYYVGCAHLECRESAHRIERPRPDGEWVKSAEVQPVLEALREREPIDLFLSHWFTQGGDAEFGALDETAATNADGFVAEILQKVRAKYRPLSEQLEAAEAEVSRLTRQQERLRAALVKLVGIDGRAELEQMELVMRQLPAPAEDKAASIDAIHALLATLPEIEAARSPEEPSR